MGLLTADYKSEIS